MHTCPIRSPGQRHCYHHLVEKARTRLVRMEVQPVLQHQAALLGQVFKGKQTLQNRLFDAQKHAV